MTPEGKTKLTIDVPVKLKQDFKVHCIQQGTTMTDLISEFMEKQIRKGKK